MISVETTQFCCSTKGSHGKTGEATLWGPFHKGTNTIHLGSTFMT